jgi:hypothetical protein
MKPSELPLLKEILDVCPETKESQGILNVTTGGTQHIDGGVVIETRGETRAWRHVITTEEIPHPDEAPAGRWQPMPADTSNDAPTRPAQPDSGHPETEN